MGITEDGLCPVCKGSVFTPGGTCVACKKKYNDAYRAKAKRAKKPKAEKARKPEKLKSAALILPAAWGIEANLEDGFLQLKQSDAEGNVDTIMLSRAELAAIVDKFGGWANE